MPISPETIVRAVLDDCPEALPMFLRNRMHCPGCVMAQFMTLAEAAESHGVEISALLAELRAAAAAQPEGAT